ncbi:GAF domain-containing SpoIIE family protein phosphatase [Nostocoides sp. HKS02]|uniref:GAF domain-containing SpoIIE family protein phosphatase n=1 Tax=Nostocoides sp. HKS02 TaxID=1813880 RepID=UPI0012B46E93|nr:GAF domain-containing SpoIIE family protein phosphatase [Tetrasphaera sp. HKS02]QGN58069.1 SpoIIE family protein phosphatase [Tetrasphaera sp. HKS02]
MLKGEPTDGGAADDAQLSQERLMTVLRAFAAAPASEELPSLVLSQAVEALHAAGGVIALVDADMVEPLVRQGYTRSELTACGPLLPGDRSLPLTWAAATGEPVWLVSQADAAQRFPRIVELVPRDERAYAVLPLRAAGAVLGVIGVSWVEPHAFSASDRELLLGLADICALHLQHWRRLGDARTDKDTSSGRSSSLGVALAPLVQALTGSDTIEDLARAIAEQGAAAVGAAFSNIAVVERGPAGDTARLYHRSTLVPQVAQRYQTILLDCSTPLGAAMSGRGEVWLGDLPQVGAQFPLLLADTSAVGLAATASLALTGRAGEVIGALGLGWDAPQTFPAAQCDELRVFAKLVADALLRAQLLAAERAALERSERLHHTFTALVASASLSEAIEAVFVDGTAPYDAAAARLALVDHEHPDTLVTIAEIGLPEEDLEALWKPPVGAAPCALADERLTAATVYLSTLDDLAVANPDTKAALERAGLRCWVGLPLRSGSHTLGALVLAFSRENALGPSDMTALSDLGAALSEAIRRAVDRDSDHDLAVLVQRSLLAEPLPDLCGMQVSASYLPADARYGIGGDWYDAIALPDGRTLLMIGDVAGHDTSAAVAMGQIRAAARALAPTHEPARLLEELDRFVTAATSQTIVTAAAVLLAPQQGSLTYSLAGHPPPMLRRPGSKLTLLEQVDPPLGVMVATRAQHTIELSPGSALVLYTDGLVERRGESIEAGLRRLAAAIDDGPAGHADALCASLLDRCMRDVPRRDDTALLCAVIEPHGPPN